MITEEKRTGLDQNYLLRHPKIQRHVRMSVIDWLYEVMNKKKITDRSVTFQAVELMDLYY